VWSYTSTPQYIFIAWCLVKHRDFTFLTLYPNGRLANLYLFVYLFIFVLSLFRCNFLCTQSKRGRKHLTSVRSATLDGVVDQNHE
jgi:hypothetical protein